MKLKNVNRMDVQMVVSTIEHSEFGTITVQDFIQTKVNGEQITVESHYFDENYRVINDKVLLDEVDKFLTLNDITIGA